MQYERAKGDDATIREWTITPALLSEIRSVIVTCGDPAFVPEFEEIEQVLLALEKIESVKSIATAQENSSR